MPSPSPGSLVVLLAAGLAGGTLHARPQEPAAPLMEFEVAAIKINDSGATQTQFEAMVIERVEPPSEN